MYAGGLFNRVPNLSHKIHIRCMKHIGEHMKTFLLAAGVFVLMLTMGGCAQMQMTCFDKATMINKKLVNWVTAEDLHHMCVLEKL